MTQNQLAVIIVSWNVKAMLADCLRSIQADLAGEQLKAEIWVVDNASHDGSAEMVAREFPEVRLIASRENLGFAGGNNAALRAIGFDQPHNDPAMLPDAVLLLNPDTIVQPGALAKIMSFLAETPEAGLAGARLVFGDGAFQHSAFDFPGLWQLAIDLLPLPGRLVESRLNGRYPQAWYEQGRPFYIGHPLGAALCARREAIRQVGLLDEAYHMYVEEVDWSRRIVDAGWQAYCVPAAVITHLGGQSTGQVKINSFLNLWISRYRFYRKFYGPLKVWAARQIVRWGMWRKARQTPGQTELLDAYRQVIKIWQG
jgi:N-acetylglucosaminyl-diphospho-decaprenol L-rhamnosyltransferase